MQTLSVGDCIRHAWEIFKQRPWLIVGGFALAMLISSLPSMFGPQPEIGPDGRIVPHPPTTYELVMLLAGIVVSIYVGLGLTTFALRAHDDVAGLELADLWNPAPFWRFLGAHVLAGLAVLVGLLLLVVPGIIIGVGLTFVPYLIVDRGAGVVDSLKESWRLTKGNKLQLFFLLLALLGLNILGLLALIIGIFVTAPLSLLALTSAYRKLAS